MKDPRIENAKRSAFPHLRPLQPVIAVAALLVLILACQVIPTPPALEETPTAIQSPTRSAQTTDTPVTSPITPVNTPPGSPSPLLAPFPTPAPNFAGLELSIWQPQNDQTVFVELPLSLDEIANQEVLAGLTNNQRAFFAQNGFLILQSRENQFSDIRDRVARYHGQPYYLTTDAAYHVLHLSFSELLTALERDELRPRLLSITQSILTEVLSYIPDAEDTALELETKLAAAYLSVALKLLEPGAEIDPELEPLVMAQIDQINTANGREYSSLFPEFEDDYSAYQPLGHYAGDPQLESYYQAMTWYGRVHFLLQSANPDEPVSRIPLLITLALRRAGEETEVTAAEKWTTLNDTLTFLIGAGDDYGPLEYAGLMDQVYGANVSLLDLADQPDWVIFRRLAGNMPPPRINSTFGNWLDQLESQRGWRFIGQRFSLDAFIMQNLVYDRVGTDQNRRELPSGLDVMAALGSPAANLALDETGATSYQGYPEQMNSLQTLIAEQPIDSWLATAGNTWLFAFKAQLAQKGDEFPPYMRTPSWAYKDLNSGLAGWVELKHDTSLYVKMPEATGGGGPPVSAPPPCFVEPNPDVFYRLAYLGNSIVDGLNQRGISGDNGDDPLGLQYQLRGMLDLADRLGRFAGLAAKELSGQSLNQDDCTLVLAPLGPVEMRIRQSQMNNLFGAAETAEEMPPLPVVTTVAGAGDRVLQVATGLANRIYVAVNQDGQLQVAQGGVSSYYEFSQPRPDRLSDQVWRQLLTPSNPELPSWTAGFLLPGGVPIDVLAFRLGDTYRITSEGNKLNMRTETSLSAQSVYQLQAGEYVIIMDGPVQAAGFTWWKFALSHDESITGWAVENPEWYRRAWGQ